jgi:hypothetical protein
MGDKMQYVMMDLKNLCGMPSVTGVINETHNKYLINLRLNF